MAVDVNCFFIEFLYCDVKYVYPTFDVCTGATVNEWMASVKNEITHVNDVGMFKMNDAVAVRVTGAMVCETDIFAVEFLVRGAAAGELAA